MQFSLLFLGLGYLNGANISFRFLGGNNCLRESSMWRRERCFLIIRSILGKLGF